MGRDLEKELKELGIINIEPSGDFSQNLILDAIESTKKIYKTIDLAAIAKEMDTREAQIEPKK